MAKNAGFTRPTWLQLRGYIGCALMFIGMLIAQLWPKKVEMASA